MCCLQTFGWSFLPSILFVKNYPYIMQETNLQNKIVFPYSVYWNELLSEQTQIRKNLSIMQFRYLGGVSLCT